MCAGSCLTTASSTARDGTMGRCGHAAMRRWDDGVCGLHLTLCLRHCARCPSGTFCLVMEEPERTRPLTKTAFRDSPSERCVVLHRGWKAWRGLN